MFHCDIDSIKTRVAQVLYTVPERGEPPGFSMSSPHLLDASILVKKSQMAIGEIHHNTGRVIVE